MEKIGILGGTFDPIHFGHLMLADQAAAALGLTKVLFVPTGRPPHKDESKLAPTRHRVEMTRLAVAGNRAFEVSTVESDEPGTSYTYLTLEKLRGQYGGGAEFYYIVGSDVLAYLTKFKNYGRLVQSCSFVAATRTGAHEAEMRALAERLAEDHGARVSLIPFAEVGISSTLIREKLAKAESVRYMLPDSVIEYIGRHGLFRNGEGTALPGYWDTVEEAGGSGAEADTYACVDSRAAACVGVDTDTCVDGNAKGGGAADSRILEMQKQLSAELSQARFEHSVGVMETAALLAKRYHADIGKAKIAGLLHDCMREAPPDELIRFCAGNGAEASEVERESPMLLHGRAGALRAKLAYGVEDGEIADAIFWHTTGCADMKRLTKIIFLADKIEPGRTFDSAREARRRALPDPDGTDTQTGAQTDAQTDRQTDPSGGAPSDDTLDDVLLFWLEDQIAHVLKTRRPLHPETVHARNWLLKGGIVGVEFKDIETKNH
ncbi:MAG: nicotinate-nucleotide adenylyltransferase [Clostridiales bacterium]|nr:nicotinate-nucleotide adenylyltransferase [Clostridiales bacterium]